MNQTVKKSEFAQMLGKGKSAVSNWIASGKLTREPRGGLVEVGGEEQIDVEAACARLKVTLDLGQQLGNAAETAQRLAAMNPAQDPPAAIAHDPTDHQIAKTEKAQADAALANLRLKQELGAWVPKEEAARTARTLAAQAIRELEQLVERELPATLAAEFNIPLPQMRAAIQNAFRLERQRLANKLIEKAKNEEKAIVA